MQTIAIWLGSCLTNTGWSCHGVAKMRAGFQEILPEICLSGKRTTSSYKFIQVHTNSYKFIHLCDTNLHKIARWFDKVHEEFVSG